MAEDKKMDVEQGEVSNPSPQENVPVEECIKQSLANAKREAEAKKTDAERIAALEEKIDKLLAAQEPQVAAASTETPKE